jgi:hypothetical protein
MTTTTTTINQDSTFSSLQSPERMTKSVRERERNIVRTMKEGEREIVA